MQINDDGTILGILLLINNLLPFLFFFIGCLFLYFSSNLLIEYSILLSQKFKISPIIIGATVVAIGTSLPELLVSLYSILFLKTKLCRIFSVTFYSFHYPSNMHLQWREA